MKRAFAFMLALVLIFSLSATAFAAEEKGSITITNATIGQTYNVFKFFNATYATDSNGDPKLDSEGNPIVSYTIDPSNQFFVAMFGADGKTENPYFDHDYVTNVVTKKGAASDLDVITYLDGLAATATADRTANATSNLVEFENLDTGYYLIDRGPASAVTLTTNMPDIEIIDKNQKPGGGFDKLVDSSSASIGDVVEFEIPFTATNYDGDEKVLYYAIHDIKSSALWVEFNSITVSVGGVDLDRGYYFFAGPVGSEAETGEWDYLGDWSGVTETPNNAQWYLIHYGYDEFEIVIPWLRDHNFNADEMANTYSLEYADPLPASRYNPTTEVVLKYAASVGPDAVTVPVKNEASLRWEHTDGPSGSGDTEETDTKVYNLGITKIANDSAKTRLPGAVFELYLDKDCTKPVNVIPTGQEGVYIVDDIDLLISGGERETSREKYASDALNAWLAADPNPDADGTNRRNDMTTPDNGQLVVLGLKAGTYYMKETEAPAGYNKLSLPVEITVGGNVISTYDNGYQVYGMNVTNNRGVELPSTGGKGTMMLITFGTMVAMAFAVLLITHKKMTIYHD